MSKYRWNRQCRTDYPGDETIARSVGTALVRTFKSYQRARRNGWKRIADARFDQVQVLRDILEEHYSAYIEPKYGTENERK